MHLKNFIDKQSKSPSDSWTEFYLEQEYNKISSYVFQEHPPPSLPNKVGVYTWAHSAEGMRLMPTLLFPIFNWINWKSLQKQECSITRSPPPPRHCREGVHGNTAWDLAKIRKPALFLYLAWYECTWPKDPILKNARGLKQMLNLIWLHNCPKLFALFVWFKYFLKLKL